jgi:glycosyltransferase involved in cell wall biosynthesis
MSPAGHVCITFWGSLVHDARLIRTAAALVQAGLEVTVVCTDTGGTLPAAEAHPAGFRIRRVRRPRPRRMRVVDGNPVIGVPGALWAAVRGAFAQLALAMAAYRTRADVYHSADIFQLVATWIVAKLRRRPIVYEAYEISTDREGFQPLVGVVRAVERFIARRVDAMFATTDMRADHFVTTYGISKPRVLQNRPPYRAPVVSNRLREHLAVPGDQPIVLYQGGLQAGRGLFNLIEAAGRVHGAVFVLMGGGSLAEPLRARVSALGLEGRVHVLPPVPADELHVWTCSADIGVQVLENTCLNHYTTDSNKLFEYVMAGLPVVASDFPEIRKVVAGHDLGMLVDSSDVSGMANAIQLLVDDSAARQRYRHNALAAAAQLSWETQVPVLLAAYRDIGLLPAAEPAVG